MEGRTLRFIKPVTRIERNELQLSALRQVRRLVDDEPAGDDTSLDGRLENRPLNEATRDQCPSRLASGRLRRSQDPRRDA